MKRWIVCLTVVAMLLSMLSGCAGGTAPTAGNTEVFRLSSIDDVTDESASRVYRVSAPYTDTYTLQSEDTSSITLYDGGTVLAQDASSLEAELQEGAEYTLEIRTSEPETRFSLHTEAKGHRITLPYDVAEPTDVTNISLTSDGEDPLVPAEVKYVPREGGTYIYSNNPEQFSFSHVGKAFMRNEGLTGEVYVTIEHANMSGRDAYLGYQLKNETDHDVYITITNVGYQWTGTWFGQLAWYDFYNTKFELPDGYYDKNGNVSKKYSSFPDYAYKDYEPRVYQPTTYRLPAGEYFWALGGTSADAYNNINVDNSADHPVNPVRCANGNVKFTVTGGEVTGTMYCYSDVKLSSIRALRIITV